MSDDTATAAAAVATITAVATAATEIAKLPYSLGKTTPNVVWFDWVMTFLCFPTSWLTCAFMI